MCISNLLLAFFFGLIIGKYQRAVVHDTTMKYEAIVAELNAEIQQLKQE